MTVDESHQATSPNITATSKLFSAIHRTAPEQLKQSLSHLCYTNSTTFTMKTAATDRTRKSRYRYDDRAMRPICECPENCKPM